MKVLDANLARRLLAQFRNWSTAATEQTGKSAFHQALEIVELRSLGGRCGISDYYWYRLYDDNYLCGQGRRDFLGWRLQKELSVALNPRDVVLPAWDKLAFMLMASSAGLPVAPPRAFFHPAQTFSPVLGQHLRSVEQVAVFLRSPSVYPLFGKPAYSQQGYGGVYLVGYEATDDSLLMLNGKRLALSEFLQRLERPVDQRFHRPAAGYLFQEGLTPAPEIAAFTGWTAICGVRIVCLNSSGCGEPIRAVWKVALEPNHVDNFSMGKYGNFLADIDLETGQVRRMVNAFGPHSRIFDRHPKTGALVQEVRLPGWDRVLEACQLGGAVFPLMKIHHWDFALTDRGPRILELNDLGATEMLQVHGRGLLTNRVRGFLKEHAATGSRSWVREL